MAKIHLATYVGRTLCGRIVTQYTDNAKKSNCLTCRSIANKNKNWASTLLPFLKK